MIELYVFSSGGKRGQRGGQTGAKKKQTEEHETARHAVLEKDTATLTQQLEDMSTTGVGGNLSIFLLYVSQYVCYFYYFFAIKLNHKKRFRKYSLNLNNMYLLDVGNPENGYHISPHLKMNCIDNHNICHNIYCIS